MSACSLELLLFCKWGFSTAAFIGTLDERTLCYGDAVLCPVTCQASLVSTLEIPQPLLLIVAAPNCFQAAPVTDWRTPFHIEDCRSTPFIITLSLCLSSAPQSSSLPLPLMVVL